MFKRYFFPTFIAILAFVACTKDVQDSGLQPTRPAGYGSVHSLSVGIESGAYVPEDVATKASMEAVIRVKWETNDEVSVVNATKGKILGGCLKANDSGTSVIFSGEVTGTINESDVLYYVYPRIAQNEIEIDFDQAGYGVSLAEQIYDGSNPGKVSFFGYAQDTATSGGQTSISKNIKFNLVTSYAHLNMANLPAAGFNLSSIDISNVNKGFTWSLSDGTLSAVAYGENEGISLACTNCKITPAGNAVVRFAIPASAATGARVVTVNKAYTNDKYVTDQLKPSAYYNQLYTSWENNVKVTSQGDKTKVDITTSEGSTDVAEGVIPVAEAFNDTKPTEIGIGGVGTVTFDATATAKIKSNADAEGSTNVFFKVEDVTETKPVQDADLVYEVTMKTVDEKGVEVFKEGKAEGVATVTVPLGEEVASVDSVALVNDSGAIIAGGVVPESVHFENGILTFQVNHFSKYAIKYTVKGGEVDYVAQIGSHKYTSLANAVAAVPTNGSKTTITMIGNDYYEVNNPIVISANLKVVLDLNGKTVSAIAPSSATSALITNYGTLTIKDSGSEGKLHMLAQSPDGREIPGYASNTVTNLGKLVVDGGIVQNETSGGAACYPIDNQTNGNLYSSTVEINGGRFIAESNTALRLFCNSKTNANTVTINDGYFEGYYYAISISNASAYPSHPNENAGTLIINGGEFESRATEYNTCISYWNDAASPNISVSITGGKFNDYVTISKNPSVTGGLFKYDSYTDTDLTPNDVYKLSDYVPYGYALVENTDSQTRSAYPWRVVANSAEGAEVSVSKPGQTTVYSTLADFRDATNAGNTFTGYTVKLLKDIDLTNDDWVPIGTFGKGDDNMYFGGIFDGDNHKISLRKTGISGDYGLFMSIGKKYGTELTIVKNLNLDVYLTSNSTNKTYIGGLADTIYGNAELENITVTGEIITGCYAGSLAGFAIEYGTATIKNCINKANITVVPPAHAEWSCIGGLVAQFDYTSVTFKNCRNEGKLSADHSKMSSQGSSYIGHMIAKGNYKNSPHDLIIENCTFSESATITGWDKKEGDYKTYPFEGKIAGTEEYSYGSGTPNLGKQMVGGYFKSCSLDGVIKNNIYPNGNSEE